MKLDGAVAILGGSRRAVLREALARVDVARYASSRQQKADILEPANHGFHNDSTHRYDEAAATLAWQRTIEFFNDTLR